MLDLLQWLTGSLMIKKIVLFINTQSIKKLKKHLKDWALSPEGWKLGEIAILMTLRS
ncbi:hypothetical protein KHA80_02335 [Anaerobacillus sp. HL2]|nr:hypothetical protein KHA80_02335 [Anaerobacillus sp. HL2]